MSKRAIGLGIAIGLGGAAVGGLAGLITGMATSDAMGEARALKRHDQTVQEYLRMSNLRIYKLPESHVVRKTYNDYMEQLEKHPQVNKWEQQIAQGRKDVGRTALTGLALGGLTAALGTYVVSANRKREERR